MVNRMRWKLMHYIVLFVTILMVTNFASFMAGTSKAKTIIIEKPIIVEKNLSVRIDCYEDIGQTYNKIKELREVFTNET